jgi:hypothetical protein
VLTGEAYRQRRPHIANTRAAFKTVVARSFGWSWSVSRARTPGTWTVKVGVFRPWSAVLLTWRDKVRTFVVAR